MKKATMSLLIGLLLGTMLAGPAVEAASGILAERSTQAVFVNGVPVELEAYNINGSNYVKLRDVGETLNFEVYWDGAAVQIDSTAPYTGLQHGGKPGCIHGPVHAGILQRCTCGA